MTNNTTAIVPGLSQSLNQIDLAVRSAVDSVELLDPIERIIALHAHVCVLKKMAKEWSELAEKKFVSVLIAHGGEDGPAEVNVGDLRFYVGTEKKVTPKDNGAVLESLLTASNGDVSTVVQALSSNPWKQGQVRQIVGDAEHNELFHTALVADLKTGKPRKGLRCVDTRFIRPRADVTEGEEVQVS